MKEDIREIIMREIWLFIYFKAFSLLLVYYAYQKCELIDEDCLLCDYLNSFFHTHSQISSKYLSEDPKLENYL